MTNPYLRLVMGEDEESTAPAGVRNPYEEMLDASLAAEERERARVLNNAFKVNPDEEAELRQLHERGKQSAMPSAPTDSAIGRLQSAFPVPPSPDMIQDKAQFKTDLTMRELMSNVAFAPALKRKYTEEDFARIASDDSRQLSVVENTLKQTGDFGRSFATGLLPSTIGLSAAGLGEWLDSAAIAWRKNVLGNIPGVAGALDKLDAQEAEFWAANPSLARAVAPVAGPGAALKTYGGVGKEVATAWRPDDIGIEDQIAEGLGQIITTVALTAATGSPVPASVAFAGMGAEQQAESLRAAGLEPSERFGELSVGAAITGGSELLRLGSIMKVLPPGVRSRVLGSVVARISGQALEEGAQEIAEGLAQNLVTTTYDPTASVFEGLAEQGGIAAATAAIFQTGVELLLPGRQRAPTAEQLAAQAALQGRSAEGQLTRLQETLDAAAQSKLINRDRAALEEFVNEAAEGTELSNVFIAPDSFAQVAGELGVDVMELARQLGVADQMQDSALTSTPITMPVGKFIATVADTDLAGPLMEVAKLNPFLPSRAEIKAAQEAGEDQFVARAEALAAAVSQDETVRVEAQAISTRIASEMNTVGRFTGDANRVYATAATQMYVQLAQRLGISPQQAFDNYPLRVAGQRIGGQPEGQVLASGRAQIVSEAQQQQMYEAADSFQEEANKVIEDSEFGYEMLDEQLAVIEAEYEARSDALREIDTVELSYNARRAFFDARFDALDPASPEYDDELAALEEEADKVEAEAFIDEQDRVAEESIRLMEESEQRLEKETERLETEARRQIEDFRRQAITDLVDRFEEAYGTAALLDTAYEAYAEYDTRERMAVTDDGEVISLRDLIARQGETLGQTRRLRSREETLKKYGLDPKKKHTTRQVAAALEARTRAKHGNIARGDYSAEAARKIRDWVVDEVMFEVDQSKDNPEKSAVGWYSEKFQIALDRMGLAFNELVDGIEGSNLPGVQQLQSKEGARQFLTALIAVTSDGAKVKDNLRFALATYAYFRENGRLPANVGFGGERNSSMNLNLANIQALLDQYGAEGMGTYLLQKDTVSNLKKVAKTNDETFNTAYKADMQLPLAALYFGPKLGAFYANLRGDTGYLTMDRWWSRTFNRYRGTLLAKPTREGLDRFKALVTEDRKLNQPASEMTDDEALALTAEYVKTYKDKKYKNGTEIEKAANTLWKAAFEKLEDQPFNASDREFMVNTTIASQKLLKRRGINLTVADIQAVLWYYEKRLYGTLGARQTADISYGDVAVEYAEGFKSGEISYQDVLGERSDDAVPGEPREESYLNQADDENISADQIVDASEDQTIGPEETFGQDEIDGTAGTAGDGRRTEESRRLAPLEGAPNVRGNTGPDPRLVAVAEQYARDNGVPLKRQAEYVDVDPARAARIADAYDAMQHAPQDPAVQEAYANLIQQTLAQYRALEAAGYQFWFYDTTNDPYDGNPQNAMRDLRSTQSMAVFSTEAGYGSNATDLDVADNPMLADTGIEWPYGAADGPMRRVLANDLFRAVHDAFGHGLEGASFRARGEENAWQAHVRLFTGSAIAAITSETRGQNSWLNFGPYADANKTARVEDTIFADQKTGLMPEWTWTEGRAADMPDADETFGQTEITQHADGTQIRVAEDVGQITVSSAYGEVKAYTKGDAVVVTGSFVEEGRRGQGIGTDLYQALANLAFERGQVLISDRSVTDQAAGAWRALAKRGYPVLENYVPGTAPDQVGGGGASPMGMNPFVALPPGKEDMSYAEAVGQLLSPAMRAAQAKMAADINEGAKRLGSKTLGQPKAPIFFSALSRFIENSKTAKAPASQWKGMITNAPGIKVEEVEMSGVMEWLDLQEGPVTREAVAAFVAANGVTVEEVVKGAPAEGNNARLEEIQREKLPLIEERDRIRVRQQDLASKIDNQTINDKEKREYKANLNRFVELGGLLVPLEQEEYNLSAPSGLDTKWSSYTLPGGENYTELLLTLPVKDPKKTTGYITVRDDDQADDILTDMSAGGLEDLDYGRTETDTGTVIEIDGFDDGTWEEVTRIAEANGARLRRVETTGTQPTYRSSHWSEPNVLAHVRFKERTGPNGERVLALEEVQSDWHQAGRERGYAGQDPMKNWEIKKDDQGYYAVGPTYDRVPFPMATTDQEAQAQVRAWVEGRASKIPNAPFKNNAWVELVLKRMVRYAAENGFDTVAWIPGNIQNGKVVEADDNRADFYDKILPNIANKFGKKYGARVEKTPMDVADPSSSYAVGAYDADGNLDMEFEDRAEAERYVAAELADGNVLTLKDLGNLKFWTLPITPQLRAVAVEEGFSLFARGRRGEYAPRLKEIRLNASADFSTFLHELGHHFLEVYDATALTLRDKEAAGETLTDGERGVLDDTRRLLTELARQTNTEVEGDVLDWWRGKAFEDRVQMHEQFARLTEAYFLDGKAPTPEMQSMFQTFKRWMLQVYSSLTELNVELNDEVRGILDRMVAAEADIKTAEENRGLNAMFATKPAFMTDDEWRGYQQLALAATQAAEDELTARSLRDMKWLSRAKAREIRKLQKEAAEQRAIVEAAVTVEVMSQPINRARTFLRKGINPDGTEVQGPHKLSIELLKAAYPDGEWKKLGYGRYGMLGKEGIDAEMAAELFGFESGDALIRALLDAEPAEATIEGETDRRMLEEFGDLVNEEAINRAADEALHNALRGRVLSAEYAALAKASGQRKMMAAAAQQIAKQVIGKQNAAKLKPQVYIAAERSAARKAEQALRRNDLVGAATAKRDQLLNFELAREAQRVLKQRDRTLNLFRQVTSAKRDTVSKTRNYDLVQVARAILAAHGMGQVRNAPIEYLDLLKRYDPRLYTSLEATLLVAVAKQKTIADLSVDEFLGLGDLIGQLWTLSREEKQVEIEGRKVELEQITTELTDRLATLGDTERGQIAEAATDAQKNMRSFVGLLASLRRVESWARSMDGGVVGPFTKYVFRPISEAADRYRADRNRLITKFRELFVAIEPTMGGKKIAAPELAYTFKNKAELLHAILHTGNTSNKRKLLLGRQWGAERPDGTLDDSSWQKFLARMAQDGTLTKADFDFAQGVWDLLEETKPLAQATHRKVFGRYFAEITAEPVVTPFGTYAGGYVPAIYDQFFVGDAAVRAQQEQVEANDSTMFPSPASGFTKGRVEYNEVLELNLQLLPMHIDRVLKFAHLASPVRDVLRILRDKGFARGLEQVDPTAQSDMLLPWLQRASRQIVEEPSKGQAGRVADQFFRGVRNRSGMGLMFANLVNVAQQFTGFPLVLLRVKPQYVGAALARYVANPARMTKAARGASLMMVERGDNQMSAMYNAIEQIIDKKNLYGRTADWLGRHTYFMQQGVQNVMDVIVWTGGYDQALARGESEAEAARQGDAAVRETQGSVFSEDISRIETGPAWARTFTHMYSYFNMWGNLLGGEVETTMREVGLRKGAGRLMFVYMIGFLAPAITAQLVADALRGQLPEDEEDDGYLDNWLSWFFMTQAKTAIAFAPIVGQAANATIGAFTAAPYDDRVGGSPAISAIEGAVRTPASVYEAVLAEGDKSRAVKDTLNLMTLLTGLPFQAAARPIGYAVDVAEGDIEPTSDLDYLRGLATGTASEASR